MHQILRRTPLATSTQMQRYLLGLGAGMLLMLGFMAATLAGLSSYGSLPPPQFSNSICMDEKIAFMRERPPVRPDLLVVGSSVGWRHFNSPLAAAHGYKPYNAALCGSPLSQTEQVTNWLTTRLTSVRQVLLIVSPIDLENCHSGTSQFDVKVADRYVFGGGFPARYYATYFDPVTFARNAASIGDRRKDIGNFGALVMNEFGDGPIEPKSRGLFYGDVDLSPSCFVSLRRTALSLQARNIDFSVALTPLSPDWMLKYDVGGRISEPMQLGVKNALQGTGASFLGSPARFQQSAFFDAIHIRWSHTPEFTSAILADLKRRAQNDGRVI